MISTKRLKQLSERTEALGGGLADDSASFLVFPIRLARHTPQPVHASKAHKVSAMTRTLPPTASPAIAPVLRPLPVARAADALGLGVVEGAAAETCRLQVSTALSGTAL